MTSRLLCAVALCAGVTSAALAETPPSAWPDPIAAPAEVLPLTVHSLLTDVTRAGERYVAVGARGAILVSDDAQNWRQANVSTRMTFTAAPHANAGIGAVLAENVKAHVDVLQLALVAVEVAHDALQRVHARFLRRHASTHVFDDGVCAADANVLLAVAGGAG